jgi:hypothetical protein
MEPVLAQQGRPSFYRISQYIKLVVPTLPEKAAEVIAETLIVASTKALAEINVKEGSKSATQSVNGRLRYNTGSGSDLFEELSTDFFNNLFGTNLVRGPLPNTRGYDARDAEPQGMDKQLFVQAKNHRDNVTPDRVSNAINGTILQTGLNLYAGEANLIVVARSFTQPTVDIVNRMTPSIMLWKCYDQDEWVFGPASQSAVEFLIKRMANGPAFKDVHMAKGMDIERRHLEGRARLQEQQRYLGDLEEMRLAFVHISSYGSALESSGDSVQFGNKTLEVEAGGKGAEVTVKPAEPAATSADTQGKKRRGGNPQDTVANKMIAALYDEYKMLKDKFCAAKADRTGVLACDVLAGNKTKTFSKFRKEFVDKEHGRKAYYYATPLPTTFEEAGEEWLKGYWAANSTDRVPRDRAAERDKRKKAKL